MTSVVVTVEGGTVEELLTMVNTRLSLPGLSLWMNTALESMLGKRAVDRFHSEGDDATGVWAALSEATQGIRSAKGYMPTGPINERTGALYSYITGGETGVRGEGEAVVATYPENVPTNPDLYSTLVHAQQGGVGKSGRPFPARPVLAVSEIDLAETELSLMEYIFLGGRS